MVITNLDVSDIKTNLFFETNSVFNFSTNFVKLLDTQTGKTNKVYINFPPNHLILLNGETSK